MKIFNTFNKLKEEFIPIEANKVRMYVCGQTVYDYCHLGHARKEVAFDMIRRWFIASGYKVTYVENITDIDDKIIMRAKENNETIWELTQRFINFMHEDFFRLGILRPDIEPKATDYISQMINIIEDLIKKGYAYLALNGDVYYSIKKFANYGKLSGKSLKDLRMGERVEIDLNKNDPMDFVLWKSSKDNEPYWDSPFGKGRPGWHIECSAMAEKLLGKNFDIHGGGQDLLFPHHENEIAQSEAHNNCKFANYWLHNGFLNINDEKMSKSLGNFSTIREVLKVHNSEVVRFFMLKTHYRSPLNFNSKSLEEAKHSLSRLYTSIKNYPNLSLTDIDWNNEFANRFKQAMDDDFNTPLAISVLFELVSEINKNSNLKLVNLLKALSNTIGILEKSPVDFLQEGNKISVEEIENLIKKREEARQNKNFQLADKIRQDLLNNNIVLEDSLGITTWRKE